MVVATTVAALATACEPTPPPVAFTVTTNDSGADADPGDGVCEATAGLGDCTFEAAVQEGNTHPRAAITVPAGTYVGLDLVVTGDIRINWGQPAEVVLADTTVQVAPGGGLSADGLRGMDPADPAPGPVTATVAGSLHLRRSVLNGATEGNDSEVLTILPGGGAVLDRSVVIGWNGAVSNAGNLVASQSSFLTASAAPRLTTEGAGTSYLRGSFLSRVANTAVLGVSCAGTPPISLGGNAFQATASSGCAPTSDDITFFTPAIAMVDGVPAPLSTAVGLDQIPVGQHGCEGGTDLLGHPRVVDGDLDGVSACDAGAVEVPN